MDKKLLALAIDSQLLLSNAHKNVLKTLLYLSVNGVVAVTAKYLGIHCKISLKTVYDCLKTLQKIGYIIPFEEPLQRNTYNLNLSKFEYLQQADYTQKALEKSLYEVSENNL